MKHAFKEGEEVYAKVNPSLKLIIRHRWRNIYYCKIKKDPKLKELVYFDVELLAETV